jgi:molybdopterin-containing oxidoreductase family iron-sulfur binding subunit
MVIDLAKCRNARKCVEECQKAHHLPPNQEFMKVYLMQESEEATPYWMPKPCFHCGQPRCVNLCPSGATFKRPDGIVVIDSELCTGCKTCVTDCPYSARQFNPGNDTEPKANQNISTKTNETDKEAKISKCDFCADMIIQGKLPRCVTACPTGTIYFGDQFKDSVTNGNETVSFSELIASRSGYCYLEELGTKPSVYYLPAVNPQFSS